MNCHDLANRHGYSVVREFAETGSGYAWVFERGTIADLWQLVTSRKIDVIVVDDLDRLAREPDYQAYLRIDAAKYDVRIEAFTGKHDDTFEGQLVAYVEKLYGKYESVKRKHRTERGRKARAESGKPISCSLPYGYRWADPERGAKSRMVIYEPDAEIVLRIFQWLKDGGTATALMHTLNAEGVSCPRPQPGKLNAWSVRTIGRIVRNDAYTGRAWAFKSHSEYHAGKRTRLPNRPEAERVALPEGTIPRLIDDETFRAADDRLKRNKKEAVRRNPYPEGFLLRGGFAKCFNCGGTLETQYFLDRKPRYYRCIPAQRRKHGCPTYSIRAQELDAAVWDTVSTFLKNPAYIEKHARKQAESDYSAQQLDSIEKAIAELSERSGNIAKIASITNHPSAQAELAMQLDAIAEQTERLEKRRAEMLEIRAAHQRVQAMLTELPSACEKRWAEIENMTYAQKRDVLAELGATVTVYPEGAIQRFVIDFDFDLEDWIRQDEADLQDILLSSNGYGEWPKNRADKRGFVAAAPKNDIDRHHCGAER